MVGIAAFSSGCSRPAKGRNGEVYKNAVQYNDYLVSRQNRIIKNVLEFVRVSDISLDSAGNLLDKYVIEIDTIIMEIKGMPPYKGDSSLRNAAVRTFTFYEKVFNNEYRQLIDLRRQGANETEEGIAEMNKIVEQITVQEEKYDKIFHNSQRDFAEKNNMRLEENEMQKKLDKINQ
jgi:hypothetical protein